MKNHACLAWVLCCLIALSATDVSAKNYKGRSPRPTVSDHTWKGFEYNFNLDDEGNLTGTNTFTRLHNVTPPRWYNEGYYFNIKRCITGTETLTITVLPGDFSYRYTLNTNLVVWDWDTHLSKWVKRNPLPYNGTRTFTVKDGVIEGRFEFPTGVDGLFVYMIYGDSEKGLIPNGSKIGWKRYDIEKNRMVDMERNIVPVGDSIRIRPSYYIDEVLKLGKFLGLQVSDDETSTKVLMKFPMSGTGLLGECFADAGVHVPYRDVYMEIGLPDLYYDLYVDPYASVTTILPNGHKQVSTLSPDGTKELIETWTEKGYDYSKKTVNGSEGETMGKRIVNDTIYIHVMDRGYEERGFHTNGKYCMTQAKQGRSKLDIDWSPLSTEGYYIIKYDNLTYHAVPKLTDESLRVTTCYDAKSRRYNVDYGKNIIRIIGEDGSKTVSIANTEELNPDALKYIGYINHPYMKVLFKGTYNTKEEPSDFTTVTIMPNGQVLRHKPTSKSSAWYNFIYSMEKKDPIGTMASLIDMELDVEDYDVTKVDAKIVGKRTAKLLKKLCSLLKQKNDHKAPMLIDEKGRTYQQIFPNSAKELFTHSNRYIDFKTVEISRVVKTGGKIHVYVTTTTNEGKTSETLLSLQNNLPVDEYYKVWEYVASKVKK